MSVIVKEDKLKQANSYVKNNREKVDNTYRQKYHIMPPILIISHLFMGG